jgi:hypothetical protein
MSSAEYQVCPECRVEYNLSAQHCVDCRVELIPPHALAPELEAEELPPAAELTCIRVAPLAWMRALSGALTQEGVAHRVEPAQPEAAPEGQRPDVFGDGDLFGLYVRDEHADVARQLDGTMAAQLIPEEAPELQEGEEDACPACGTPLTSQDVACPDCGLDFS